MVKSYRAFDKKLVLSADLAAAAPVYLFVPGNRKEVLYSQDVNALLTEAGSRDSLEVCPEGLSFLLLSGAVPPPKTVYSNLFMLGIGDKATLDTVNGEAAVRFDYEFPFRNNKRPTGADFSLDDDSFLELLADDAIVQMDSTRPSFLFHSAGKDSNSIALALADAGVQDQITLITHKSKGKKDESDVSRKIAEKLGFRHQVLREYDFLTDELKKEISEYFARAPLPCVDGVSLAYPLYAAQLPELKGANILDGMGNDVYIGHIPAMDEFKKQRLAHLFQYLRPFSDRAESESLLHALGKYRTEHTGLGGFSPSEVKRFFPACIDSTSVWKNLNHGQDYLDLRAEVRGRVIDQEVFIRKVRNFASAYDSRLILPWASPKVAQYFSEVPEGMVFDRASLKNKLVLRRLLKNRVGLDSDELGKLGFSYDKSSVVLDNRGWVESEILGCALWVTQEVKRVVERLYQSARESGRKSDVALSLIYRLLLISLWHRNSQFLNRGKA